MPHRRQLTLFILPHQAAAIEAIRQQFNPAQYALIKSHITLCREDELGQMETILQNLRNLKHPPITLQLGPAIRFAEGKGVLLPIINDTVFQQLRAAILQGIIDTPRIHEPHITLLHPRNATCTDSIFEQIQNTPLPQQLTFSCISLIEQVDGGPWVTLQEFTLR